jgi:hypothetical protein
MQNSIPNSADIRSVDGQTLCRYQGPDKPTRSQMTLYELTSSLVTQASSINAHHVDTKHPTCCSKQTARCTIKGCAHRLTIHRCVRHTANIPQKATEVTSSNMPARVPQLQHTSATALAPSCQRLIQPNRAGAVLSTDTK